MSRTKVRLEKEREVKGLKLPDRYLICIKTPTKAYVVEGKKDFHLGTEYGQTIWFEFLSGIAKCSGPKVQKILKKFGLMLIPPGIVLPETQHLLKIEHLQDGTLLFKGRLLDPTSALYSDPQRCTFELIELFQSISTVQDDELRAHLQAYGFGVYDL